MSVVYFDLLTASSKHHDILQIAAKCWGRTFSCYVQPLRKNPKMATHIHGFAFSRGVLYYYDSAIQTVSLRVALNMFLDYLCSLDEPCLLVGHNVSFDSNALLKAIIFCHLVDDYESCIFGFVDTCPILKMLVPYAENYKLEALAEYFGIITFGMPNAVINVRVLQEVFETAGGNGVDLSKYVNTYNQSIERRKFLDQKTYIHSMKPLVSFGVLSKPMIIKAAEAGISMGHILLALDNHGEEGLIKLFAQFLGGRACEDAAYSVATFVSERYLCNQCKVTLLELANVYGQPGESFFFSNC